MPRCITSIFLFFALLTSGFIAGQALPEFPYVSQDSTKAEMEVLFDSIYSFSSAEFYKRNYDFTLEYGEKALILAKKIKDKHREFRIKSVLGNTLLRINDTARAKAMFIESIDIAKRRKDTAAIVGSNIDLGNVYTTQDNKPKAIQIFKEILPMAVRSGDTVRMFIINMNMAELYLNDNDVKNADIHITAVDQFMDALSSKFYHSGYHLYKGRSFLLRNQLDSAIARFRKNITIAKKANYMDGILDGYTYYLKALEKQQDYLAIYEIRKDFDFYNNEKLALEKAAAIEAATAKFNIEKYKEKLKATELQNKLAEQTAYRNRMMFFGVLAVATILAIYLVTLLISYRKRKILLEDLRDKNLKYLAAKEKSEELANAKSKFFSNISHELRTPLYGIIGISSILMDDKKLKDHKEDITSLKFSADYLLSLINDVLQLNKLEATRDEQLNLAPFQLGELVQSITKSFEFMRVQNNNVFNIIIASDIPNQIEGDRVKLSQILMNLIGNACKFTENGAISLKVETEEIQDDRIKLAFQLKDTGVGISKEKQQNIFDEFTQDTNKSNFQGTGLGLPIVKKLLDLHNSDIQLISERGEGTQFNFSIWYDMVDIELTAKNVAVPLETDSIKGKHILVVDDNRINQIVTQKILEKHGANSSVADNGKSAVHAVKENGKIDLILMDINMPIMNGFEATKNIRKFNPHIPIIALTAVEIDEMKEEIYSSGMNDFIVKPYDEPAFIKSIWENMS